MIIFIIRWYKKKFKKEDSECQEIVDNRPAHVIAYEQLELLRQKQLWQKSLFKEYYTDLTDILRQYIDKRFNISAMEMSSEDLIGEFKSHKDLNSNKELMSEIKRMIKRLGVIYGDLLQEVILYGSYARGTQTEESDVDIALLLSKKPASKMTDKMIKCVSEAELNTGKVLSVVDIERDSFDHWKNALPFYRNIQKEGICIWKER